MFQKPFRIKTQTAIKGSDRKKLRTEVGRQYPSIADQLAEIIPNKEEMTTVKIYTHNGDTMLVYVVQRLPIFFEHDKAIYPTVYTLWKFPELLPVFTTWPAVFSNLAGGADLMLPGLIIKGDVTPRSLGHMGMMDKGTVCAVKLLGNRAPIAVGRTIMSTSDMYDANMKGKGIQTIHILHDFLWSHGDKNQPPLIEDPEMMAVAAGNEEEEEEETAEVSNAVGTLLLEDTESEIPNSAKKEANKEIEGGCDDTEEKSPAEVGAVGSDIDETEENEENDGDEDKAMTSGEMDDLLTHCFLCALKIKVKKSDLPLLTSAFYSRHLLPCRPKGTRLDIKKSTYKKLSKFLQGMKKEGLIDVKELSKGVESITAIHRDHPRLRSLEFDESTMVGDGEDEVENIGATAAPYQPPKITAMFMVTANTLPLFSTAGYCKGKALTAMDIRNVLVNYVKANELQSPNKGFVVLDGHLSDIALNKNEYIEQMSWEDLMKRCQTKMTSAYQLEYPGQKPIIKKGALAPIEINIVTRASNKKATLIDNLHVYGINPHEFAHTVQVNVACSATCSPNTTKGNAMQVMVQGNQINFIAQLLLDRYHLQRKWIQGLEKAPKGKKKR